MERTRSAVLGAARELLEEGGWDAVTHVAVAQRSGVGRTTLYRHWPTADLLLRELIAVACAAETGGDTGDLRADLVAHLDQFRRRLLDPSVERSIATVIERATVDPTYSRLRAAVTSDCTAPLVAALRRGIASGELRPGTDVGVAVDELAGPLAFRRLFSRKRATAAFVREVVDDFLAAHGTAG